MPLASSKVVTGRYIQMYACISIVLSGWAMLDNR